MTDTLHYDLYVIGAGSGGASVARRASAFGAKVGICEGSRVGGTCVIRGCVPKKMMVYLSEFQHQFNIAADYGWAIPQTPTLNYSQFVAKKDAEIDRLNGIYLKMLKNNNVDLHEDFGSFINENTLQVGDKIITADRFIIATGGTPFMPDIEGKEHAFVSDDIFNMKELPPSMIVVGGGYIAVEFACIFQQLGVEVMLIYRGEQILRGFDHHVRSHLTEQLQQKGLKILTNTDVNALKKEGNIITAKLSNGETISSFCTLFATGRKPNIEQLGLKNANVNVNSKNAVIVDDNYITSNPNILAIGDVIDKVNLTPVALNQGRLLAENLYNNNNISLSYDYIPSAVFSQPEIATCGLTEEQAREKYGEVDIYLSRFRPMKFALGDAQDKTLMKLIVAAKSDRVVGAHMVGDYAAEIMQAMAVAMNCNATKAQFDATIGIHPSSSEEFVTMREKYTGD